MLLFIFRQHFVVRPLDIKLSVNSRNQLLLAAASNGGLQDPLHGWPYIRCCFSGILSQFRLE